MKVVKNFLLIGFVSCLFVFGIAQQSFAATLNVTDGILDGASDVDVGGSLYDVEFIEGTAVDLFGSGQYSLDGIDTNMADLMSYALLDQVFINDGTNDFDIDVDLTFGISYTGYAVVMTAYDQAPNYDYDNNNYYLVSRALNNDEVADNINNSPYYGLADTATAPEGDWHVYAVWTPAGAPVEGGSSPVPEPATMILFGLGLLGLAGINRRKK